MTCTYCGCRNADGEHRCWRCGRKPGDTLTENYSLRTEGALAAIPQQTPVAQSPPARVTPNLARAVQRPLFSDRAAPNVIPFEEYAPPAVEPRSRKSETKPRGTQQRRAPRVSDAQAKLDFLPADPAQPRTLGTTVEAVIYCDAPVATPLHRAVAAALDWSMVVIGYGLFLLAFSLCGGEFVFNKSGMLVFGGALLLIAFTYGMFWTVAGTETPGMRWTRLQLLTFDGFPPELHHRVLRLAGSCLSFCTVVGLLWSLADEESLTWQDHISGTFPTPRDSESQVFRRL